MKMMNLPDLFELEADYYSALLMAHRGYNSFTVWYIYEDREIVEGVGWNTDLIKWL